MRTPRVDERYARVAYAMMDGKDKDALTLFEMEEGLQTRACRIGFSTRSCVIALGGTSTREDLFERILANGES